MKKRESEISYFGRALGKLPLGMLLSADSDEILGSGTERKRESTDDDRRAIKTLLIREGRTPWREEEELRHTYGLMLQLTSAVSYCDYESEAEMNKLGALQDRWLRRFAGEHEKYAKRMAKGVTQKVSAKQDGTRTETDIIDFSSVKVGNIPAEGMRIECGALHGMSGFGSVSAADVGMGAGIAAGIAAG